MAMHTNGPEPGARLRLLKDENDHLRALNAEMQEALKELHALIDFDEPITNDKPMLFKDASAINEAMKRARAILAKTEA